MIENLDICDFCHHNTVSFCMLATVARLQDDTVNKCSFFRSATRKDFNKINIPTLVPYGTQKEDDDLESSSFVEESELLSAIF